MGIEARSVYRKFATLARKLDPEVQSVATGREYSYIINALDCKPMTWVDQNKNINGEVGLVALPMPVGLGYIELTMKLTTKQQLPNGTGVKFTITPEEVRVQELTYYPAVDIWEEGYTSMDALERYGRQLVKTAEIIEEKYEEKQKI